MFPVESASAVCQGVVWNGVSTCPGISEAQATKAVGASLGYNVGRAGPSLPQTKGSDGIMVMSPPQRLMRRLYRKSSQLLPTWWFQSAGAVIAFPLISQNKRWADAPNDGHELQRHITSWFGRFGSHAFQPRSASAIRGNHRRVTSVPEVAKRVSNRDS